MDKKNIVITYTTKYRLGGDKFERVAETMKDELSLSTDAHVICSRVESKRDLTALFYDLVENEQTIWQFHFIGHSGMYGPMFGTIEYPEQFSPFEWHTLKIPFAQDAQAYFHCCRSARWFTNFFANTFKIPSYGYHLYTSFSARKDRFKPDVLKKGPLYSIGCKGKKSHGIPGSVKKYMGTRTEVMKRFEPGDNTDASYDEVAQLYDKVFQDIKVREDEWAWILKHLPKNTNATVLDIGCGNGALLKELAPNIAHGIGIDQSKNIIQKACNLNKETPNLQFHHVQGPSIPLENDSVDLVISMLSFRYLDWDPLLSEVKRILRPGGKMLIVDMVAVPIKRKEIFKLLRSKLKHYQHRKKYPEFYTALKTLVAHPAWKTMLAYNPIRSEHEMKWYLESRFPGKKMEKINVGYHSSVVAFDTGDFHNYRALELSYP